MPNLISFSFSKGPVQISWASAVIEGTLGAHFTSVFNDPSHWQEWLILYLFFHNVFFVLIRVFIYKSVPPINLYEIIVSNVVSRIWNLIKQLPSSSRDCVVSKEAITFIGLFHTMNPISFLLSSESTSDVFGMFYICFFSLVLFVF